MKRYEQGTTTVEFAIVATLAVILLFGVIEISRALFVWNSLAEATRRGARVAAVCPMNNPAIARIAIFGDPNGSNNSPILSGLTTSNVSVSYLDSTGATATSYGSVAYVRVSINNYLQTLMIPFLLPTITAPPFTTTIPAESLGYDPDTGVRTC